MTFILTLWAFFLWGLICFCFGASRGAERVRGQISVFLKDRYPKTFPEGLQ